MLLSLGLGYGAVTRGGGIIAESYFGEMSEQGRTTLRLAVSALGGLLNRYEPLPALIADHDDIEELVAHPKDAELRQRANVYLKSINTLLESSDIYIITLDGETIAASNYDGPTSFVGENFSYRPYFQDAAKGLQSRFFALGTTSHKRGYYFSAPILFNEEIKGVIVFKVDIEGIEASFGDGENRILVSDPEGIIFMTGTPQWLYSGLMPLTPERLARTEASRRYANATLKELPLKNGNFGSHQLMTIAQDDGEREYMLLSQPMPDAGWTVSVLMDTGSLRTQVKTAMIAIILCLCLAAAVIAAMLQRRRRLRERLIHQAEAQAELERRVEERTADLARVNQEIEHEIAERRQTEKQLRKMQNDLVQAGKLAALGQMSAALSHEFNQPLAAAKNYAENASLLVERGRLAEVTENLRRISGLIDRMASISKHLRNFARKPNEKMAAVGLEAVLRDTLEIVGARLKAADAVLDVDLGPVQLAVKAGPVRLQQVLVNIISNAADAVEGREDRHIALQAVQHGQMVSIFIRDRGPGVPAAISERIFDPFFTTKGVGRGLGLGLSISYNIIKDFGGQLRVRNHEEGGAEFEIELPAAAWRVEAAAE
ncbi:two-component system C4-dicarboxylate transport sensor histidine kinase DctB [Agrobacterium tumefaciens]|uniref:sensor histidine kinase n=1 Tax=Agrobacterium TaxID=357 RepID=UPI0013A6CEC4|nr:MULTISPECIES: sensor histidine kinase [Agrobacterium]MBB4404460.1 two-component system C4-dicarboxylate transport sensor histidine kinase DctB [Agrobacterium radiobacter]MBB4452133.1 two-component system C4-dicarboxylate transport sensor histidine kinase DctB [Agrobacterium radiobacter]MBP2508004.1 two-component system C4-dicarboxylate transport sensor histidine kinase DctB [Agrobacterium tumefaciens]MBP2515595.1 two-component system C4-dicarboxylate transport sensor histidine kinase DctB [A